MEGNMMAQMVASMMGGQKRPAAGGMMLMMKRQKMGLDLLGAGGDAEKADLVQRIKNLQRSNPDIKQAWWTYTDSHYGGVHDPNRLEKTTLQEFLATYE